MIAPTVGVSGERREPAACRVRPRLDWPWTEPEPQERNVPRCGRAPSRARIEPGGRARALGGADVPREPKTGVSGDTALAEDDLVDTPGGNPDVLGQAVPAESEGFQELGQEDFDRVDGCELCHGDHLRVVVDDIDVEGIGGVRDEADAPRIVDADAELASTTALERLKPIAGWNAGVGEGVGRIENDHFPKRDVLRAGWQPTRAATLRERLRIGVAEGADHAPR